ncbi:MAG: hypothetical protein R3A10_22110 [Caldilineaceae bacterium]
MTAGLETPYAKARALERYLRQFEYDLTVAASRSRRDGRCRLFPLRLAAGYCDYYATVRGAGAWAGLPTLSRRAAVIGQWDGYNRRVDRSGGPFVA